MGRGRRGEREKTTKLNNRKVMEVCMQRDVAIAVLQGAAMTLAAN